MQGLEALQLPRRLLRLPLKNWSRHSSSSRVSSHLKTSPSMRRKLLPPKQQERVKLRERELLEAVERQANYTKQEQKHLELIAKHEHNLAQLRAMLESVRTQLAEVRDTVGALRALVSETREPSNNPVVPPLPPPREPPQMEDGRILPTRGSAQDFLPIDASCTYHTQIDLDTDVEEETGTVQSKGNKKRVLMKLKGSSSSVRTENMRN